MNQYDIFVEFCDKSWIASCNELRLTLEDGSLDALVVRMKVAIQEIAEIELGYNGNIRLVISFCDRLEEIKAAS